MKSSTIANHWNKIKQNTYVKGGDDLGNLIRFDTGEPWFPLTPSVTTFLKTLNRGRFKVRPDIDNAKLKSAASRFWNVPKEQIAVSNGSDQFIWLIPRLFMDPHDFALTIEPTFFLFSEATKRAGGRITSITNNDNPLKIVRKNGFKIIWVCNPNNPTGSTIPLSEIRKIVKSTDALIIVDEAFFDLSDLPSKESATNLIKKHENVIVLKTLSKTFGLSNIRIGFAFAQETIIKSLNDWRLPFSVSGIAQEIGCKVLDDKKHWKHVKEELVREKEWLVKELKKIKDIEIFEGSKTNILLIKHVKKNLFKELLKKNVMAADFNSCRGIEGKRFVRISVLNRKNNKVLLRALRKI